MFKSWSHFQGKPIALRAQNCMVEPHINCCNHLVNCKPKFQSPWWKTPMPPALAPAKTTKDDLLIFFGGPWWQWTYRRSQKWTIFMMHAVFCGKWFIRISGIITTRYTRLWSIHWNHAKMISTYCSFYYVLLISQAAATVFVYMKYLARSQKEL